MQIDIVTRKDSDGVVGVRRTRSNMSFNDIKEVLRAYGDVRETRDAYGDLIVVSDVDRSNVAAIEAELSRVSVS